MKRDRVRDQLLELITGRAGGEALPSERELCEQLGVSRPTLRSAIDELARAGLVVRQQGRGTFTSPQRITQALTPIAASSFHVPPAEGNWLSKILQFEAKPAGPRLGQRLQISPADLVQHIVRLRTVDDEPIGIENLHLPAKLVPDLKQADLESGSFYQLLRMRYELVVTDATQTIEPTVTDTTEAELLGVPAYAPALLFERTARSAGGRTVEFTRSIYRGDRYRITSELKFDNTSG